jgi:hypothetical protein
MCTVIVLLSEEISGGPEAMSGLAEEAVFGLFEYSGRCVAKMTV